LVDLATIWEGTANGVPSAMAVAHGDETITWGEWEQLAARVAGGLQALGLGPGDRVGLHLRNHPDHLTALFATCKLRAVACTVNTRYVADELEHVFADAELAAVVTEPDLLAAALEARDRVPSVRTVIVVGAAPDPLPPGVTAFADLVDHAPADPVERSGDDLWILYTGGTTGRPKGVMWPQASLLEGARPNFARHDLELPVDRDTAAAAARVLHEVGAAPRLLVAAPLVHGTAAMTAFQALLPAGAVVTLTSPSFDADEALAAVERHRATDIAIVGDPFARPLLAAMERADVHGRSYDLGSLTRITSSGAIFSDASKDALLARLDILVVDALGASEGIGFGLSLRSRARPAARKGFRLGPNAAVFTPDGRPVEPGSGEIGQLAVAGAIPLGYLNDPERSAATFRVIDGRRWSIPGDHARVEADGLITLLGRGSLVINTAGEKVHPEEVERALLADPSVVDCLVVGLPDERWGEAVTAVVVLAPGAHLDDAGVRTITEGKLAGYKRPKRVVVVDGIRRHANGKADYAWARDAARDAVAREQA
jgi:3-oxocholest-4-en-26-oate---CoA ligase